jgi:hypothetical protein
VSPAVASHEKDVETMPTQKTFKGRIRARMSKTGESYTAARRQLMQKAPDASSDLALDGSATQAVSPDVMVTSDSATVRATGRTHAEWFALLDEWEATGRGHTEIARWLSEEHGVPPWWTQSITVAYERARGLRARHEMADGFSVSATRTVAADPETCLAAFTDPTVRERWFPDAPLQPRPTRAKLTARFDWADPASRVVVTIAPKDPGRSLVAVTHERIPDEESGDRLKTAWRARLGALKSVLESR